MQDVKEVESILGAKPLKKSFSNYEHLVEKDSKKFRPLTKNSVIFPNSFALIVTMEKGKKIVQPMRYRLRPHWAEKDLPSKYNLHNARVDHLQDSRMWKSLFGKQHGVLGFFWFYEWVEDPQTQKKIMITFRPEGHEILWTPVIYDRWAPKKTDKEQSPFASFTMITSDPPGDIERMGKDRFPVVLKKSSLEDWLSPEKHSQEDLLKILHDQEVHSFYHEAVKKKVG